MIREWIRRFRLLGRRPEFEAGLDEEIRFHLETRIAELVDSGMPPRAAYYRARKEFGPIARSQERTRAVWQVQWIVDLATDFRLALRSFRRSPGFAVTAIASLGLGIGATSAIFSMMDAALWRPMAVVEPDRLMRLAVERKGDGLEDDLPGAFVQQLRRLSVFQGVLTSGGDGVSFEYDGRAERIIGEVVSPEYFDVVGVPPLLGQHFTPETRAGRWAPEAVLSYNFWKRRFAGDPAVIGRTIRLNTRSFTIVGVSPGSFSGLTRGRDYELQIPRLPNGQAVRELTLLGGGSDNDWINVMARLAPGVTPAQAEAAVDAQLREFLRTTSIRRFQQAGIERARVLPGGHGWIEEDLNGFRAPLYALLAMVVLVLLIACANLAGMLLARATARARELAIRCSIGAGRARMIRQMLAESLALSLLGGLAGLALAGPAGRLLFGFLPQGHVALVIDIRTEGRVLFFTFGLILLTGLLFGLIPAILATRGNLAASLKSSIGAGRGARMRGVLVAAQVAFSLALLVSTGAFVRTLMQLRPAEFSRAPERVLLFTMKPPYELYPQERLRPLLAELVRRISALPGVQAAALAESGPLGSRASGDPVTLPGGAVAQAESDLVSPGFFEVAGIPRIAGRDFTHADRFGGPPVAIVNQKLARALFGDQNPVGRSLTIPRGKMDGLYEIIGVVRDGHYFDAHKPPRPGLWLSGTQSGFYMPTLFVKSARADTGALTAEIRRELDAIDKGFPIFNIRTMEGRIRDALARERMVAQFSAALGALALLMAAVGLYGILAYAVTRRTREIGIRMALGSDAGGVVRLVARDAVRLVAAGAIAGMILALAMQRALAAYLPAVSPAGFTVLAGACGVLCLMAGAAMIVPATRAARVDPLTALRVE